MEALSALGLILSKVMVKAELVVGARRLQTPVMAQTAPPPSLVTSHRMLAYQEASPW